MTDTGKKEGVVKEMVECDLLVALEVRRQTGQIQLGQGVGPNNGGRLQESKM